MGPDTFDCWLYPELKRFPSGAARKQALKQALRETKGDWRGAAVIWIGTGLLLLWLWLQTLLAPYLLLRGLQVWVGKAIGMVVAAGVTHLASADRRPMPLGGRSEVRG